jgi:hypothetical protein
MLNKFHLTAPSLQFLHEEDLMHIFAGKTIGRCDENPIKGRSCYLIS